MVRQWERSSREDAPSRREFRSLMSAARHDVPDEFREECEFMLVTMGKLGLRAGEMVHMKREWLDQDRCIIHIPEFEPCDFGEDGGICGYCRAQAQQQVERNDEVNDMGTALARRWSPKMEASARDIPYGFNVDIVSIYDEFWHDKDRYPASRVSVNRRIDRLAEHAKLIDDKEDIYPHALRGHAATEHAKNGVGPFELAKVMGWEGVKGAMPYIKMAANDVREEFKRVYGESQPSIHL